MPGQIHYSPSRAPAQDRRPTDQQTGHNRYQIPIAGHDIALDPLTRVTTECALFVTPPDDRTTGDVMTAGDVTVERRGGRTGSGTEVMVRQRYWSQTPTEAEQPVAETDKAKWHGGICWIGKSDEGRR